MLNYVGDNLAGAWAIMLGRRDGLSRIDLSVEGFWRSFAAIILLIPFVMLALLSQRQMMAAVDSDEASAVPVGGFGLETIALAADWVMFPVVFAGLARPLGLAGRYVPFIVVRNWAAVILSAMLAPVHALHIVGILPSSVVPFLLLVMLAVALRFSYAVARTALDAPMGLAIGVVALDFLISLVIWSAADRFS